MYAIQVGSKFAKVDYYIDPSKVWNVIISDTPKIYKKKSEAAVDFDRMDDWLDQQILHAEKVIEANTAAVAKYRADIARLEAKLETLLDLPFREVEKKVENTRSAIRRADTDLRSCSSSLRSYKKDLARYNKIVTEGAGVVCLQQAVEAL